MQVRSRGRKALRVLAGVALMSAFVLIALGVLTRYAGAWGVPYFDFTSARGSSCTNTLTGYVCEPLNLADVEFYGDVDLPADTRVLTAHYRSTHDYELVAELTVPATSGAAALKALNESFGPCQKEQVAPLDTRGLSGICVMNNDDALTETGEPDSRLFSVGTGLRKDGTRVIGLQIRSR